MLIFIKFILLNWGRVSLIEVDYEGNWCRETGNKYKDFLCGWGRMLKTNDGKMEGILDEYYHGGGFILSPKEDIIIWWWNKGSYRHLVQWLRHQLDHHHSIPELLGLSLCSSSDSASCQCTPWKVGDGWLKLQFPPPVWGIWIKFPALYFSLSPTLAITIILEWTSGWKCTYARSLSSSQLTKYLFWMMGKVGERYRGRKVCKRNGQKMRWCPEYWWSYWLGQEQDQL